MIECILLVAASLACVTAIGYGVKIRIPKRLSIWQYGTVDIHDYSGIHNQVARRHRVDRNVQFILWKAGECGHKNDFWIDIDSSHWKYFKPNKIVMKTGMQLIEQERHEQIHKHGFDVKRDRNYYIDGELVMASQFCVEQAEKEPGAEEKYFWPSKWDKKSEDKIRVKDKIGQYAVAGALLMAENERTGVDLLTTDIAEIAKKMDALLKTK